MLLVSSCATVIIILLWIRLLAIVVAIALSHLDVRRRFDFLLVFFRRCCRLIGYGTTSCIAVVCCDWCISYEYRFCKPLFHQRSALLVVTILALFQLMLLWIASFTFLVYQWLSLLLNLFFSAAARLRYFLECSETTMFWAHPVRVL